MITTVNAPSDGPAAAPPLKTCAIAEIGAIAHLYLRQRQSLIAIG